MKANENIILIGGGGHCKACIDVIETENKFQIIGIIDVPEKLGQVILGYKIIGNDDNIPDFAKQGYNFLITIGHLGNPNQRIKLYDIVKENGGLLPVIISPIAHVSKHSSILQGTIIMHHALINADAKISENCIINNKALIEHDVIIEDNTHISTGALINGNCRIGKNCLVGSGVVVKQLINICQNTIVGAGAVVVCDIVNSGIYTGIPAKKKDNE
ncbi:MAG: acetyltransferase [Candidatus Atribacteria bacterium]|nr:acetyltransferase [Candidatus Atribacteria bacterium]